MECKDDSDVGNKFKFPGSGLVPTYKTTMKAIGENAVADKLMLHKQFGEMIKYSKEGMTVAEVTTYFETLLGCKGAEEPVVESGGTYGVTDKFNNLNGPLLVHQTQCGAAFEALDAEDRKRATAILDIMFLNPVLRNRNPLHPSVVDASIMGNLINFPKHLFGMGYGGYASDGNEALSLVLYSYRQRLKERLNLDALTDKTLRVLFIQTDGKDDKNLAELRYVCTRLVLELEVVASSALETLDHARVACTIVDFESADIERVAEWSEARRVGCHIHITDGQLRRVFTGNDNPVHFDFPSGVESLSIEEGMLSCGYSLYQNYELRDYQLDIPYEWQCAYLSPNEGGSGSTRPLLKDLCTFMLGWASMSKIAYAVPLSDRRQYTLRPVDLDVNATPRAIRSKSFDEILKWSKDQANPQTTEGWISHLDLEHDLVRFQQGFMGGEGVEGLQCLVSGGGTRSINYAFEAVFRRVQQAVGKKPFQMKILTGNPHFAVERAKRRFSFQLVRIHKAGALDVDQLKKLISDPTVVGVYAQSLSYSDGISDSLTEILEVIETENIRRKDTPGLEEMPVSFINDSCLAFSVIAHHDGKKDPCNMRLLDVADKHITPLLVINDAHKHLGTDKGLSTVIGSRGSLSFLRACVKVGAQPSRNDLLRAVVDLHFVGRDGYFKLYSRLSQAMAKLIECVKSNGLKVVHSEGRLYASSVVTVEDPGGAMIIQMKKKGHKLTQVYSICPEDPSRCQTGWQLSMTPHHLREVPGPDGTPIVALDLLMADLNAVCKKNRASAKMKLVMALLGQNSFVGNLLFGNPTAVMCTILGGGDGFFRNLATTLIRRFSTAQLDGGTTRLAKPKTKRGVMFSPMLQLLVVALLLLFLRRRLSS